MSTIKLNGTTSGSSIIKAPDSGSTNQTFTLPASTGTLAKTSDIPSGITSSADATAITIDSSENVGFGVTPETDWYPKVIQSGNRGAVYGYSNQTHLSNNAKMIDVSENYKYMESSYATDYSQEGGTHQFKVAASGTADAAITWTTALNITNDGRGLSQFTAKAWCMFDPTPTIQDSHNISSVTDSGVGNFRVNFSNNLANAAYAAVGTASNTSGSHNDNLAVSYEAYNTASTAAWLIYRTGNTSQADPDRFHSVYFGD